MKKVCFLFLVLVNSVVCTSHPTSSKQGKFHVVIVGDSNDHYIGTSVDVDIANIKKSVAAIGKGIGYKLHTVVLRGGNCTGEAVHEVLCNLHTSSKDIIWFYYSGHGHHQSCVNTLWPVLETHSQLVYGSRVFAFLKKKKKRSSLIFFDCCNSYQHGGKRGHFYKPFFLKKKHGLAVFYNFLASYKGTVVVSASRVGETAHGDDNIGGSCTRGFLKAIYDLGRDGQISWDKLLKLTATKTNGISNRHFGYNQIPIYNIYDN
jgi:hypothetical protein